MAENKTSKNQGAPMWLRAVVAAVVVGLGGWGLFRVVMPKMPPKPVAVEIEQRTKKGQRDPAQGISRNGAKTQVRIDDFLSTFERGADGNVKTTFDLIPTLSATLTTQAEGEILRLRQELLGQKDVMAAIGLNKEDQQRLKALPGVRRQPDGESRRRIIDLYTAWESAPEDAKGPAEQALLEAMREIVNPQLDGYRQSVRARVEQTQKILTPEQLAKAKELLKATP